MVITIYVSGISGNKEVKKRQQRVLMILDSRGIQYEVIDIAEPGRQAERDRLKTCGATPPGLPPQLFNGDEYCGDYDQFDLANEIDELDKFLKEEISSDASNLKKVSVENGLSNSRENTPEKVNKEESTKLDPEVDDNSAFIRSEENLIEESKNLEEEVKENADVESGISENVDKEDEEEEEENESENDEE